MLTEPKIDKDLIRNKVEQNYGFTITKLTPVQAGEASWCYKVDTENEVYFLKIYVNLKNHEPLFNLTYNLYNSGIRNITHPLKNKNGDLVIDIANHYAALFNYIDGYNASEKEMTGEEKFSLGKLLGQIHESKETALNFELKEDFIYGNLNRLLENINKSSELKNDSSIYKKEAANLLIENKEKILNRINNLKTLGDKLRGENLAFVICHGEPHIWNTMIDKNGEVYLIDWDDSMMAPKEKDLNMIKDDPKKLEGYKSVVGDLEISPEIISYYNLEWNISEIDAWSDQILNSDFNEEQNKHDLEFLMKVLKELDLEY